MTNLEITNAYVGDAQVEKIYLGADVIYELDPTCYLGEWSFNAEEETYNFNISNTGDTVWENGVNIGKVLGVYLNGSEEAIDTDMMLIIELDNLFIGFGTGDESPGHSFMAGSSEYWLTDEVMTEPGQEAGYVFVSFNGTDTFTFGASTEYPLSISTINPECPTSE